MTREPYASYVVHYILEQCSAVESEMRERLEAAIAELRSSDLSDAEIDEIERRVRNNLIGCASAERLPLIAA